MGLTTLALAASLATQGQITAPIEVPFRITEDNDAMIVDATLNGKTCSFMYDTGFGGEFVLNDRINIGKPSGYVTLRDFVGELQAPIVTVNTLSIGGLKIQSNEIECVQQPTSSFTLSYGMHCDGIMGFGVTKDFVTEINIEKKKFVFHPSSMDISKRKPDGVKTFLVRLEDHGLNSLELKCEINNKPLTLALDTGNAFYTTTHKEVLERVGAWDNKKKPKFMKQSWVASGPVDSFSIFLKDSKIFGVPVSEAVWDIIDLPSSSAEHDGTVGFGFLRNFNIIIDYDRRYVWLENFTGKVSDPPLAEPGLLVYPDRSGKYIIRRVYPGGPADAAGIKEGDALMMVGTKSMTMVRPSELEALLRGPEGSTVKIATSRAGILSRNELKRALMVNGRD